MRKPILCLDFDGVIHGYQSGWKGADIVPDAPVPGAIDFILEALLSFEVHIFSSRSHQSGGIYAMKDWLCKHIEPISTLHASDIVENEIKWPVEKPPAMVTIDDRAITFTGTWPSIESLKTFKPWNKP